MTASVYMWTLIKTTKRKLLQYNSQLSLSSSLHEFVLYLHVISLELTFASLDALKPAVVNVPVAGTSTTLKPSTARSATTASAGFLERAALWARRRTSGHWCDGWSADRRSRYEFSFRYWPT